VFNIVNKSSAVAEMGDLGHNRQGPKRAGVLCLGRGLSPFQVSAWSMQPFGRNRYGPKIGELCPFGEGELGLYL